MILNAIGSQHISLNNIIFHASDKGIRGLELEINYSNYLKNIFEILKNNSTFEKMNRKLFGLKPLKLMNTNENPTKASKNLDAFKSQETDLSKIEGGGTYPNVLPDDPTKLDPNDPDVINAGTGEIATDSGDGSGTYVHTSTG